MGLKNVLNALADAPKVSVFDWERAASLISASGVLEAYAGIAGDWESTAAPIWEDGRVVLDAQAQVWTERAGMKPCLEIDGKRIECFKEMWSNDISYAEQKKIWPGNSAAILVPASRCPKP